MSHKKSNRCGSAVLTSSVAREFTYGTTLMSVSKRSDCGNRSSVPNYDVC